MDAKALAKSKRAHSIQHSRKPRSGQKLKVPSASPGDAASGKKPSGKQVGDKERPFRPGLPSNLNRYGEELDLDSEELSTDVANEKSDVVLPKSKGADYSHLIADAQSQIRSDSYASGFLSLEDVLPVDIMDALGSMFSVMGESFLSWTGDDNFVVDDGTTASHETSFLSLNLDALAEQLGKVDISERLFIEADLIPPELHTDDGSRASHNPALDQKQATCESEAVMRTSEEQTSKEHSERLRIVDQNTKATLSGSAASCYPEPMLFDQGSNLSNQVIGKSDQSIDLDYPTNLNVSSAVDLKSKQPTFEAAAAETELDMLLDSFSKNRFLDSSSVSSGYTFLVAENESAIRGHDATKITSIAPIIDDVLDNLLDEISNHNQRVVSQAPPLHVQSSSSSVSKSEVLDDFDSWLDTI